MFASTAGAVDTAPAQACLQAVLVCQTSPCAAAKPRVLLRDLQSVLGTREQCRHPLHRGSRPRGGSSPDTAASLYSGGLGAAAACVRCARRTAGHLSGRRLGSTAPGAPADTPPSWLLNATVSSNPSPRVQLCYAGVHHGHEHLRNDHSCQPCTPAGAAGGFTAHYLACKSACNQEPLAYT